MVVVNFKSWLFFKEDHYFSKIVKVFSNFDLATLIPTRNLEMSVLHDWKLGMTVFIDRISNACRVFSRSICFSDYFN